MRTSLISLGTFLALLGTPVAASAVYYYDQDCICHLYNNEGECTNYSCIDRPYYRARASRSTPYDRYSSITSGSNYRRNTYRSNRYRNDYYYNDYYDNDYYDYHDNDRHKDRYDNYYYSNGKYYYNDYDYDDRYYSRIRSSNKYCSSSRSRNIYSSSISRQRDCDWY